MAQAVERILGKDEVGGSSPPSSSKKALASASAFFQPKIRIKIFQKNITNSPCLEIYGFQGFFYSNGDDGEKAHCILTRIRVRGNVRFLFQAQELHDLCRIHAIFL